LTCPDEQEQNLTKTGCASCEYNEYSNSSSNNICTICPSGQEPNSTQSGCASCEYNEYSNFYTNNICIMCFKGFEPSGEGDDCIFCEENMYSNPAEGMLCVTCESIREMDLCESVRGPSSEQCFWIEDDKSELEIHCVVKV
jgi:hypothetical protein